MVTVEINVTKKDIGSGVCFDPGNCPIARALLRVMKQGSKVGVSSGWASLYGAEDIYLGQAPLPKLAAEFVNSFDNKIKEVKPFSFNLRVKNSAAKLFRKSALATA